MFNYCLEIWKITFHSGELERGCYKLKKIARCTIGAPVSISEQVIYHDFCLRESKTKSG